MEIEPGNSRMPWNATLCARRVEGISADLESGWAVLHGTNLWSRHEVYWLIVLLCNLGSEEFQGWAPVLFNSETDELQLVSVSPWRGLCCGAGYLKDAMWPGKYESSQLRLHFRFLGSGVFLAHINGYWSFWKSILNHGALRWGHEKVSPGCSRLWPMMHVFIQCPCYPEFAFSAANWGSASIIILGSVSLLQQSNVV